MKCDQCSACVIQGVFCHETGCPNMRKVWLPDSERWVRIVECNQCGDEVVVGDYHECGVYEESEDEDDTACDVAGADCGQGE